MKLKPQARILLLDDEVENRSMLALALTEEGYEVEAADSGAEAISLHTQNPFDVVVLELFIKGQDGFEALKALAQQSANTKFIATAKASLIAPEISLRMARQLGAQFSLPRPFRYGDLVAVVRKALGQS